MSTRKNRSFCITEFNMEKYEEWKNLDLEALKIKYIAYQQETAPTTGKDHLQVYVEFENALSYSGVQKRLGINKSHIEARKGNRNQARDYSLKTEELVKTKYPKWLEHGWRKPLTEPVELGIWTVKGRANALTELYEMVKEGASDWMLQERYPDTYAKHYKALQRMRFNWLDETLPMFREVNVHVLYGETRSGKTRKAMKGPDCFKLTCEGSQLWFDGYRGQKTLVIDDFYGQIRFAQMLQLLDKYKRQVQTKGGWVWAEWDTIYITSNCHPEKWYNSYATIPSEKKFALYERFASLTQIIRPPDAPKRRGLPPLQIITSDDKVVTSNEEVALSVLPDSASPSDSLDKDGANHSDSPVENDAPVGTELAGNTIPQVLSRSSSSSPVPMSISEEYISFSDDEDEIEAEFEAESRLADIL